MKGIMCLGSALVEEAGKEQRDVHGVVYLWLYVREKVFRSF